MWLAKLFSGARAALVVAALSTLAASSMAPASAATRVEKTFGKWVVTCVDNDAGARTCSMTQQVAAAAFGDEFRDVRFGIAEVAEVPRARRAGLHAGGLAFDFVEVFVVDAIDAHRAFLLHDLDRPIFARALARCPLPQLATDP